MAMPMADNRFVCVIFRRRLRPPPLARTRQRRLQFLFNHRLAWGVWKTLENAAKIFQ
jgi:hypothetical protein